MGALTPLMMLPAISYTYGATAWGAIALGQSIGGGGAVLVELGWGLTGPQLVAGSESPARRRFYETALRTKVVTVVPVSALCGGIAVVLAPAHALECAAMAVATSAYGLTVAWYFIGIGSASGILLLDVLPKVLGTAMGSLGLILGYPLFFLPLCLLIAVVAGPAAGLIVVRRSCRHSEGRVESLWQSLRLQVMAIVARGLSAVYITLPITLVAVAAPALVPTFAAIERLLRLALVALQAIPNVLQAWLGSAPDIATRDERARRAIMWNVVLGVTAGSVFALLTPPVGGLLFDRTIHFDPLSCAIGGLIILVACTSRATGSLGLVSINRIDVLAWAAGIAAVLGIALIPTLSAIWGVPGGFVGELVSESVNLAIQYFVLRRHVSGLL